MVQPARALVDPLDGVPAAVEARRFGFALIILSLCAASSGAAFSARWDGTGQVVAELTGKGELKKVSEREIAEKIETAERVKLVGSVAKGLLVTPLLVVLLTVVLKLTAWLFGRKVPFGKGLAAAAVAMLPLAVFHLLLALSCLRSEGVAEAALPTLLPSSLAALVQSSPPWTRLLSSIEFFNLWSVALLGLGFSAASGMKRLSGLAVSVGLFVVYLAVFAVGLGGMKGAAS